MNFKSTGLVTFASAVTTIVAMGLSSAPALANPFAVKSYEDLDFEGDFVYAVNFNGRGTQTVGDAVFTNVFANGSGSPNGVDVNGFNRNLNWGGASNLGNTASDNALESVMRSIIWSAGISQGGFDVEVSQGTDYRLQLLFSEGCCNNRNFDVNVEDSSFLGKVLGTSVGGSLWRSSPTQGYAMTWDFTATDTNLDIDLLRPNPRTGDTNYHISGFTLERLGSSASTPEPASLLALVSIAGLGLATKRKRSESVE